MRSWAPLRSVMVSWVVSIRLCPSNSSCLESRPCTREVLTPSQKSLDVGAIHHQRQPEQRARAPDRFPPPSEPWARRRAKKLRSPSYCLRRPNAGSGAMERIDRSHLPKGSDLTPLIPFLSYPQLSHSPDLSILKANLIAPLADGTQNFCWLPFGV